MQMSKAQSSRKRAGAPTHAELFEPIRIGNCEIKNRIAMAPMNTVLSMDNRGYTNEQIMAYYAARAKAARG
jgi:2-enoate reductase